MKTLIAVASSVLFAMCFGVLRQASAEGCPSGNVPIKQVTNALDEYLQNDRAPAGADCAYEWAATIDLSNTKLTTDVLEFFRRAGHIHRQAADKRLASQKQAEADVYLVHEIQLRKRFLEEALARSTRGPSGDDLQSHAVRHLSYLISAMALRKEYEQVAKDLANRQTSIIDEEAIKVWIQALWSCAKWDGNKGNLCASKQQCKDQISLFLDAVGEIERRGRSFPPGTRREIQSLQKLASTNGCLNK